jgi:uncharacterized protein (TIGR02300 family)
MSVKAERGTKRTCQNAQCGARFYDLNRDPVTCPICQTVYELAMSHTAVAAVAPAPKAVDPRKVKKPVFAEVKADDAPEAEGEEALVALEDEEAATPGEDDETFLEEEEEDGADMSNIIGGPVAEGEEQS